jgi:uncharacterized coiled-coil protein SlyX
MDALKADNLEILKSHTDKHIKGMEEMAVKHKLEIDDLKKSIENLTFKMCSLSDQSVGEKGVLQVEMNKLETKYANMQKDFEQKKKEGERAEGVQDSLKSQVESLREELKANQRAYQVRTYVHI